MDGPLVSVLIPVFNGERYVRQAIDSALGQTYPPHEIIVVDDGSTDSSRAIAESYGGKVVCIAQPNQGPSAARNRLIEASSGDWIAFLDCDDYWFPDKLEKQVAAVKQNPPADLIYTGRIEIDEYGRATDYPARSAEWVKRNLPVLNPIYPSSVLARRSVMQRQRWTTEFRSSEDWWFFYELAKEANFCCIEEPTFYYRVHSQSLTNRNWRRVLEDARRVARKIQADTHGLERFTIRHRVDAKLLANAAVAARIAEARGYFPFIVRSLLSWPFPDVMPERYRMCAVMLLQTLRGSQPGR